MGVGHRANSPIPEKKNIMEMATEEINTTGCDGLPESLQDTHVNASGESREEINDRKMEVLSAKT